MSGSPPPRVRWAPVAVGVMTATWAVAFAVLSLLRHRAFETARFDLGNLTQAVWSAAHGDLLISTDIAGEQLSRLGGHVEPILFLFVPLWWAWPSPSMLLVVQAAAVSTAAIPAYLLARRWLGDARLAVAFAAVTLLYPAVQWATLFDFHPVTLAIPLILWTIWAAAADRMVLMAVFAVGAAATKEQVGLAIMILGIWVAVSLRRRLAGLLLAAGGLAWSVAAFAVVIPRHRNAGAAAVVEERYGDLGSSAGELARSILTRPWDVAEVLLDGRRAAYLAALLVPLLGLSLFAPLLAAGALPDLMINMLSSRPEQQAIEYHYGAVVAPFLIAAAIRGLMWLRGRRSRRVSAVAGRSGAVAVVLVAAGFVAGWHHGPLPLWQHVPGGSTIRGGEFTGPPNADALREAVGTIPDGVPVSAGNRIGGHLSARRRILTFPAIGEARWVIVDRTRPEMGFVPDPPAHARAVAALLARPDATPVFDRDGVLVVRLEPGG